MPLHKFIEVINKQLCDLWKNGKYHGLAQSITRRRGEGTESLPGVLKGSELEYVGLDDKFPIALYHKLTGISTTRTAGVTGYGDSVNIVNTYALSLVAFMDIKKTKLTADEAFLYIQERIPFSLKGDPYGTVLVRITNVILNVEQIFAAEYKGTEFKLPADKVLFQINYTIESTHKKGCFEKCPEDC